MDPIYLNPSARDLPVSAPTITTTTNTNTNTQTTATTTASSSPSNDSNPILTFHKSLPSYARTPLHRLPALAASLGLRQVLLKDESSRFGLPAFKILGASWAVYRAVLSLLDLEFHDALSSSSSSAAAEAPPTLKELRQIIAERGGGGLRIVTATDGNCGRAIARVAAGYLGLPVNVYVPGFVPETTRRLIRDEGRGVGGDGKGKGKVEVLVVEDGDYDKAVAVAWGVVLEGRSTKNSSNNGKVELVLDVSFEGYTQIPQFFVQGYSTMLAESDQQVAAAFLADDDDSAAGSGAAAITHAFVPVGAGSIAQAVTQHYKAAGAGRGGGKTAVIAVEPTTAACLRASLCAGEMRSIDTEDTIMCGMNCGTLSVSAWPVLRSGVDASVVVTDAEAHVAVEDLLKTEGAVQAGPCGAATLAALRRVCDDEQARTALGLDHNSTVVLYCTEGAREYEVPSSA